MRAALAIALLALSGCAGSYPQLVMVNRRTGATVDCQVPDLTATASDFLVSRACLSACQAHGFRAMPGVQAPSGTASIPDACQ